MAERATTGTAGVVTYVSTAPAYVGGGYVEPGTPFATAARPGRAWTVVGPGAAAPRARDDDKH